MLKFKYIDENIYKKSKPSFSEDKFLYKRAEKHGFISCHSRDLPTVQEIFINPTAYEFLKLCNGERTPEDISEKAVEIFNGVSKEKIYDDLKKVLFQYGKYAIIDWEKGVNPFMNTYNTILEDKFTLALADETYLRELKAFFGSEESQGQKYYINPNRRIEEYTDELVLRQKLFMFSEEFVVVKDENNNIVGILSILIPVNMKSTVSSIGIIKMSTEFIPKALDFIVGIIQEISVEELTKVKYQHIVGDSKNEELRDIFLNKGFISEAILKNEFEDKDIESISNIL